MTNPMLAELDEVAARLGSTDQREVIDATYNAAHFLRTHHATIADMAKRLEAAQRDAARLDYLDSRSLPFSLSWDNDMEVGIPKKEGYTVYPFVRQAIDAATQEGEG